MTDVPQQDHRPVSEDKPARAFRPRIPDIELANISRFRGELMGAAMIIIILFHIDLPRDDAFFGLRRMGNLGVDMFLFLSGIGLWFAWSKRPDWRHFLRRRFVRIYPCWLIIACAYYIPRFHGGSAWAWIDLLGEIGFNWEFWLRDELTFWYVPAIMLLYLFAPPYMALITKHPIYKWLPAAMIMWCILVQWVTPIHNAVGHLEIFWSRVPIFFIGINMGEIVRQKRRRRCGHLARHHPIRHGTGLKHLPRAGTPRRVPPLHRAHALHPTDGHFHPAAQPHLPASASMGEPLFRLCRRPLSGMLSHSHTLRARLSAARMELLAYLPGLHRSHPSCRMDTEPDR